MQLTWTQTNSPSKTWVGVQISSDGQRILGSVQGEKLWYSSDSGANFSQLTNSAIKNWYPNRGIAMSYSGQYMIATTGSDNKIRISQDYGATWIEKTPATGNDGFRDCACSSSGQYMVTHASDTQGLWKSSDYGNNWSNISPVVGIDYSQLSMSASGAKIMLISFDTGNRYFSTNYGTSWSTISVGYGRQGFTLNDGNGIVVGAYNFGNIPYYLWRSTDDGSNWTSTGANFGGSGWNSFGANSDGSVVLVGATSTQLCLSIDSGVTWDFQTGTTSGNWNIDVSGSKMAGSRNGGVIVTSDYEPPPILCWNYKARYKDSSRLWTSNGPGKYPSELKVPASVDIASGVMMDEGKLISPDRFRVIQ